MAATRTNLVKPSGMVSALIWKESGVSEFLVGKSQRVVLRLSASEDDRASVSSRVWRWFDNPMIIFRAINQGRCRTLVVLRTVNRRWSGRFWIALSICFYHAIEHYTAVAARIPPKRICENR
jgi:hypothetical protein